MENNNDNHLMSVPELLAVWGLAFAGGSLGSIVIGILGVFLAIHSYPNTKIEHGAALVGALCGSIFSIPIGIFVGGAIGVLIFNRLLKRNSQRPALPASVSAFVISAMISGVSLVPIGFLFFALGHI